MSQPLLNHPYRDCWNGQIVIPIRVYQTHAGALVIYKHYSEEIENVMGIECWYRYCVPIVFDSVEGP